MYNILWADFLPSFDVVHVDQVICWLLVGSKVAASFYMVLWVVSHMGCRVSMEGFKWLLKDITYCILWTDVVASCPKVQKSDFQNQFSMTKIIGIFRKKNHFNDLQAGPSENH